MYARITRDLIAQGDWPSEAGTILLDDGCTDQDDLLKVRLLDDDREVYYHAVADDEALEELFEWAMADTGCTILQTQRENGEYEDCLS